tara:strand:- start:20 stop:994 length:975 start_codon:yes stop_codon:yes gene_type:complete
MKIISYCNNKYPESYGGVSRFDYCLSLAFPDRLFFKGPEEIDNLLNFYKKNKNDYIIITDNHLSSQIPDNIPLIVVHHGVARTHLEREPNWEEIWKNRCVYGQDLMFLLRSPRNTLFVSPTKFCINEFGRIYGTQYDEYKNICIPHASELDESKFKVSLNKKPIIIGNWSQNHKGKNLIPELEKSLPEFEFRPLNVDLKNKTVEQFNELKQQLYLEADIYLCLSVIEGSSYSVLDGMLNNLLIVSTDVGIMENEVSKDSFVMIPWKDIEIKNISEKIRFIWKNKEKYFNKSRLEYFKLTNFENWSKSWKSLLKDFEISKVNLLY